MNKEQLNKITVGDVNAELKRLMQENPDFIYRSVGGLNGSCQYTDGDNCTGCIFGQALTNLGISEEDLKKVENQPIHSAWVDLGQPRLDEKMNLVWSDIQSEQDIGNKWGNLLVHIEKLTQ